MLIYLSVMVGGYIFTRMLTAGIRDYPNEDKFTKGVVRVLSILTALLALGCTAMIAIQGFENTFQELLK
jgi:hypothetical protein